MKITVTIAAQVGIPGYVPNASQEIELPPDANAFQQETLLGQALILAFHELKAGLASDRTLLTVGD